MNPFDVFGQKYNDVPFTIDLANLKKVWRVLRHDVGKYARKGDAVSWNGDGYYHAFQDTIAGETFITWYPSHDGWGIYITEKDVE